MEHYQPSLTSPRQVFMMLQLVMRIQAIIHLIISLEIILLRGTESPRGGSVKHSFYVKHKNDFSLFFFFFFNNV